jgi:hypothetical protein
MRISKSQHIWAADPHVTNRRQVALMKLDIRHEASEIDSIPKLLFVNSEIRNEPFCPCQENMIVDMQVIATEAL